MLFFTCSVGSFSSGRLSLRAAEADEAAEGKGGSTWWSWLWLSSLLKLSTCCCTKVLSTGWSGEGGATVINGGDAEERVYRGGASKGVLRGGRRQKEFKGKE